MTKPAPPPENRPLKGNGPYLSAPMLDVARQLIVQAGTAIAPFVEADAQTYPLGRPMLATMAEEYVARQSANGSGSRSPPGWSLRAARDRLDG
jgi:hypothetical protein